MNRVVPFAIVALGLLAFATLMLVIAPGIQIRAQAPSPGLQPYTQEQQRGRDQYVSLGCVYCHSQQPRAADQAPDDERGWGRASVSSDYVYDAPHQLGTMRTGPDLLNIGSRLPSRDWHLTHLYQPRAIFNWSIMPAYPFLFERKEQPQDGDVVLAYLGKFAPETGVIIARQAALDLVSYLQGLDRTYPAQPNALRDDGYAEKEEAAQ